MKDYLVKAHAYDATVRIYAASTTTLVAHAQDIHGLWPTSAAAFGRLLTASVIMGAMYKGDQELTIRVDGDGPIGGMVATTNAHGEVRGYVGNPRVFLQYNSGKLNVGQAVGNGFIHITKDLKVKDMFTSSAEIQTGEIGDDFAYYFTASEQIPSAVGLGVLVNDDNTILSSGGFILQIMPGCSEETIEQIETILKDIKPVSEMIQEGYKPEDVIRDLTNNEYKLLEHLDLEYKCDCNREKFEKGLISLGVAELETFLEDEDPIETSCHFCNTKYHFSNDDINQLIHEIKSAK
ncbi:Hsp33 family molecular chaperone HslO [Candidatus Xianfuyuplasma coldseepsis]|uniref:33 kDa chaperonin n=1 Tax=Candidatus Xianfuyuplasma coldseepsis TaxID=2782163 RepID=A0A7L7KQQ8_9MOLU|nr:Hsp33 family molecular chaperone HslO [Xianfuyuplasma coldseepsis]QMS84915.1 Hsp33 family molecular chaperone HslO [Xianfuyuplasma coldseepsis]